MKGFMKLEKKMLTKKFFDENHVKEFSAQRLVYSSLLYDGLEEIAYGFSIRRKRIY